MVFSFSLVAFLKLLVVVLVRFYTHHRGPSAPPPRPRHGAEWGGAVCGAPAGDHAEGPTRWEIGRGVGENLSLPSELPPVIVIGFGSKTESCHGGLVIFWSSYSYKDEEAKNKASEKAMKRDMLAGVLGGVCR